MKCLAFPESMSALCPWTPVHSGYLISIWGENPNKRTSKRPRHPVARHGIREPPTSTLRAGATVWEVWSKHCDPVTAARHRWGSPLPRGHSRSGRIVFLSFKQSTWGSQLLTATDRLPVHWPVPKVEHRESTHWSWSYSMNTLCPAVSTPAWLCNSTLRLHALGQQTLALV